MHGRSPRGDLLALSAVALVLLAAPAASAQSHADSTAIRQTALDYVEGWYERDQERVRQAVHPELAKRIVWRTGERDRLGSQGADELVRRTGQGAASGPRAPEARRKKDIEILDRYRNIAVVRVGSNEYVDYLQVARWRGDWKIVNILWDLRPGVREGQHSR